MFWTKKKSIDVDCPVEDASGKLFRLMSSLHPEYEKCNPHISCSKATWDSLPYISEMLSLYIRRVAKRDDSIPYGEVRYGVDVPIHSDDQ